MDFRKPSVYPENRTNEYALARTAYNDKVKGIYKNILDNLDSIFTEEHSYREYSYYDLLNEITDIETDFIESEKERRNELNLLLYDQLLADIRYSVESARVKYIPEYHIPLAWFERTALEEREKLFKQHRVKDAYLRLHKVFKAEVILNKRVEHTDEVPHLEHLRERKTALALKTTKAHSDLYKLVVDPLVESLRSRFTQFKDRVEAVANSVKNTRKESVKESVPKRKATQEQEESEQPSSSSIVIRLKRPRFD